MKEERGIYLNGEALDLNSIIDFDVRMESFSFHFIYHTPAKKSITKRSTLRSGRVKVLNPEEYVKGLINACNKELKKGR